MKKKIAQVVIGLSLVMPMETFSLVSESTGKTPAGLEKFLSVSGARTTLPVDKAKKPYSNEFIKEARENFDNFHLQMGGDHALYYNMHLSEFLPSSDSLPNETYMPLKTKINKKIGKITVQTGQGELTLDEYANHPMFRLQGLMMIHKGEIVYENYPGMNPNDKHVWMSAAKSTVGLVITQLIAEGKVDPEKSITKYVPQLKGTNWDGVKTINVLNHTTGLDLEETGASILNPESEVVRFFSATFGAANPATGKVENWIDVLRDAKKLDEAPGTQFRYSSPNTLVLIQMAENIEGISWAKLFQERVWGKMGARMSATHNLTPEGTATAFGLTATTLEDMARFGMLFTPSWKKTAHEKVVNDEVLKIIYEGQDKKAFIGSAKAKSAPSVFGEFKPVAVSHQFDYIFEDGAMFKSGNLGQGIYIDPARDFVGVYFSTNPYIDGYGEVKAPEYIRKAAIELSGK